MKNEDKHMDFREQIVRYLSGEMSPGEEASFLEKVNSERELKELFDEYQSIWKGVDSFAARSKYNLDSEWSMLESKIDFEEKEQKVIPLSRYILRIAAVLIIGLAGLGAYYIIRNSVVYEQVAREEGQGLVELPDGSRVTLNAGSTIKYDMESRSGDRKVILNGEAYFEVARDTSRPFIIDAGAASVRVLGTSFNVNAYKDNNTVEVTVTSGMVSMVSQKNKDQHLILNPGNAGVYDKARKQLELRKEADLNTIAWKTRELTFNNTPLGEVASILEHAYQVPVKLASASLENCPITVSFHKQELQAVLNVITETLDLELSREGAVYVLDGEGCN